MYTLNTWFIYIYNKHPVLCRELPYDFVQAQSGSDEDSAKAYRLSQANAMIRWRNPVSQNEELFMEYASDGYRALYMQLNTWKKAYLSQGFYFLDTMKSK